MEADHDRLDELWERATALRGSDPAESLRLLRRFADGLHRHLGAEEEFLFPFFEERSEPSARGLTDLLRDEHREILRALATVLAEAGSSSGHPEGPEADLRSSLWAHNAREEGKLYPWLDARPDEGADRRLAEELTARIGDPAGSETPGASSAGRQSSDSPQRST